MTVVRIGLISAPLRRVKLMVKLIFGCGFLGGRVARRWIESGDEVIVVTRRAERADTLAASGMEPIVADITRPGALPPLPAADTVLFSIGFDRTSGQTIYDVYLEGLRHVLSALPRQTRRFVYISSTGVYGQTDGSWVDERSECRPERAGGRACLAAEQLLGQHELADRAIILRLAGLYGPGRVPRLDQLMAGAAIEAPSRGYLNLIHVDDAVAIILALEAAEEPRSLQLFVASDGAPVLRSDYYRELARLAGAPEPRFEEPSGDSPKALRAASSKRVSNRRMRDQLNVRLLYPTYREGLAAILAASSESVDR